MLGDPSPWRHSATTPAPGNSRDYPSHVPWSPNEPIAKVSGLQRVILVLVGGYVLIALGNKVAEAAGAMTCDCVNDCWCKRPGLNLFRWVFPWGHHRTHTTDEKARFDADA